MSPAHLRALRDWPVASANESSSAAAEAVIAVTQLLAAPFTLRPAMPETDTSEYLVLFSELHMSASLVAPLPYIAQCSMIEAR